MSSIYNLIGDPRPYIRTLALSHEDLNKEIVDMLTNDSNETVRMAVAEKKLNLNQLVNDSSSKVAIEVLKHNYGADVIEQNFDINNKLSTYSSNTDITDVVDNPSIIIKSNMVEHNGYDLEGAYQTNIPFILCTLAKEGYKISELQNNENAIVRRFAEKTQAEIDSLGHLSKDKKIELINDDRFRGYFVNDSDVDVRKALITSHNGYALDVLKDDIDPSVSLMAKQKIIEKNMYLLPENRSRIENDIREQFDKINQITEAISNFPIIDEGEMNNVSDALGGVDLGIYSLEYLIDNKCIIDDSEFIRELGYVPRPYNLKENKIILVDDNGGEIFVATDDPQKIFDELEENGYFNSFEERNYDFSGVTEEFGLNPEATRKAFEIGAMDIPFEVQQIEYLKQLDEKASLDSQENLDTQKRNERSLNMEENFKGSKVAELSIKEVALKDIENSVDVNRYYDVDAWQEKIEQLEGAESISRFALDEDVEEFYDAHKTEIESKIDGMSKLLDLDKESILGISDESSKIDYKRSASIVAYHLSMTEIKNEIENGTFQIPPMSEEQENKILGLKSIESNRDFDME